MFLKHATILLALLLTLSSAYALMVGAPLTVEADQLGTIFNIEITNTSNQTYSPEVNIYSPVSVTLLKLPGAIEPGAQGMAKALLDYNDDLAGEKYNAIIEVTLGNETSRQEIEIVFKAKEVALKAIDVKKAAEEERKKAEEAAMAGTGFMTLGTPNVELTPETEMVLDGILLVVGAVLLIAFIARLNHRMRGY